MCSHRSCIFFSCSIFSLRAFSAWFGGENESNPPARFFFFVDRVSRGENVLPLSLATFEYQELKIIKAPMLS